MTSRDFCYWLQGYFELEASCEHHPKEYFDKKMTDTVKRHLALVFKHEIDPSIDGGKKPLAEELQKIHDGEKLLYPIVPPPDGPVYRC